MRLVPAVLAAALLLPAANTAAAQRDEVYRGTSFAFGIGRGSMSIKCKGCETSDQADISGMGRIAWAWRENLTVGFEALGFQKAQIINLETVNATFVFGGPVLLWYPRQYSDMFLKVGGGMSSSSGTFNAQSSIPTKLELNGPTVLAGVGMDLRFGQRFSLTPYIDYYKPASKDADLGGGASVTISSHTLNFGVALTYH